VPQVVSHQRLPGPLLNQIRQIMHDVAHPKHSELYEKVLSDLAREYGFKTYDRSMDGLLFSPYALFGAENALWQHIDRAKDVEFVLSALEFFFQDAKALYFDDTGIEEGIEELNHRLRQHGVGYAFEGTEFVPLESHLLHEGAMKPALAILAEPAYAAADKELRRALDHYRHGRHEEAISEAAKSFESVLKVICAKRRWAYDPTAPAKKLLDVVYANSLIPSYLQTELTGLRAVLEGGVAVIRNKNSAHGAGEAPREVPAHMVSFTLHLAASSILFLTRCEAEVP